MQWNVFYHNWNKQQIDTFNVFDHGRFRKEVLEFLNKYENRDEFAEQMRRSLFYYFCSKCEWEVLITPWVANETDKSEKVDVYQQIMMNWDRFIDYVWSQKGVEP